MAHYPADTFQEATEIAIEASNQLHGVINGDANAEVTVEDGSKIPSVRKALLDNFYFKDPIAWQTGQTETVFNQLRQFTDGSWWYAPSATASNPISMGSSPVGDVLWKIYDFDAIGKLTPQIREALRRSYAEAGYNLVDGSFEAGGTLVNANDVLLQERTGKAFSGPAGTVAAGTNPASGGFVDKSGGLLRHELATSASAISNANGGSVQDFIDTNTFKTVAEMKAFTNHIVGSKVVWQGYYEPNDGGGNTGIVKTGAHTPDGGSIFSIDANTYVEANLNSDKVNIRCFGANVDVENNAPFIQSAVNYCASLPNGGRGSLYVPHGTYDISTQITWRTQVSMFGDGKSNSTFRWYGDDATWAIVAESTGCYDLCMRDFGLFGPEFTATKFLLNTRKFRYSTFNNLWIGDCKVCNIMGACWGNEYVHCAFTPRISTPSDDYTGCVGVWMEDTQVANAMSFRHNRFQFAEVGMLVKSGGRAFSITGANIFESCDTGIKIQSKFVKNFHVSDNYFEFLRLGPVWLERTGMQGWLNGVNVKDNYIICNASEFAVFKLTGEDFTNRSSVVIENNAVEFAVINQQPTSGYFLYTPDGTRNCTLTYNQGHIVTPFNNLEVYKHYDENAVWLPTFTSDVPFELAYSVDDQGNSFVGQNKDVLVGIPKNGQMHVLGTALSSTQVSNGSVVVANLPLSCSQGLNSTYFMVTMNNIATPIRGLRNGTAIDLSGMASGAVARIDFSYAMRDGNIIKNDVP